MAVNGYSVGRSSSMPNFSGVVLTKSIWIFAAILLAGCATMTSGCATITKGTTQSVAVNTPGAVGASCTLASSAIGSINVVTPATITLDKSQESVTVRCHKECFQDGAGIIASGTETMTAGNVLVGGVVGLGVDAMSGAMNKYNSQNDIVMVPIQGCRPTQTFDKTGRSPGA